MTLVEGLLGFLVVLVADIRAEVDGTWTSNATAWIVALAWVWFMYWGVPAGRR